MKRRDFLTIGAAALAANASAEAAPADTDERNAGSSGTAAVSPTKLRCEYRANPLGIDVLQPRLSWISVARERGERGLRQSAYQILAATTPARLDAGDGDLWNTGKVVSDRSTQIEYAGKPLRSRRHVWWKVRVWDQDGNASSWSEPATWSMGLLQPSDWSGSWIGLNADEETPEEFSGAQWIGGAPESAARAQWFRTTFDVAESNPVSAAVLAAATSGTISVYVNGDRTGPAQDYAAHDASGQLQIGRNVVAIKVTGGDLPAAVIAGLTLDLADGTIVHVQTGGDWKVSGTRQDGWERPDFDDGAWESARVVPSRALPEVAKRGQRTRLPAFMLRKEFHLKAAPRRAIAYVSGPGCFELYLNGRRASDDLFAQALTDYDKRVLYRTYDVSDLLRHGDNAVGILLGNARFYAPRRDIPTATRTFGQPRALLELEIEYGNGERVRVASDGSWTGTTSGPIRANNYYDGEEYDARMEQPGWASPRFAREGWTPVQIVDPPAGALRAQMIEPMRVTDELRPVKMTQPAPGVYVFDLGQNISGWCRLRVAGPAGTRVTLRHGETLRPDGFVYLDNLRSARQLDVYVLRGGGEEVYAPRFTSHGFQFVELRGFPGVPTLETITGLVVRDAMGEHADFTTSSPILNHIYRNVLWGTRGNFHTIPTDCPQRDERQGWLGDRSAVCTGNAFMFDAAAFYSKWVQDIEDSMNARGSISDVCPAYWPFYNDNVTWPASFFFVTEMLHRQYGDETIIRKHYPAMKRWIDHMSGYIVDDLMPRDTYGDWCVPPTSPKTIVSNDPKTNTAHEILGSAYFYHLLNLMAEYAPIAGYPQDAGNYRTMAAKMGAALNSKYLHPGTNTYDNASQTSSLLSLAIGYAPEERRTAIADALVRNIETKTDGHLQTGLIGGQWLMRTLTAAGHADVAYRIATQTTYPSWYYMIGRGATTIWELWNGDTANPAMNSRNHLMLVGDLCIWFYEDLAGIKTDPNHPGFKHVLVRPRIAGDLTFVRASHQSPYGLIATEWHRSGRNLTLNVSIPPNATATVFVPTTDARSVRESGTDIVAAVPHAAAAGTHAAAVRGVRRLASTEGAAVYEIESGDYAFTSIV